MVVSSPPCGFGFRCSVFWQQSRPYWRAMTRKSSRLEFSNAIICEDVREEKSGKFILIGVYLDDVLLSRIPGRVTLRAWAQLRPNKNKITVEFRFLHGDKVIAHGTGDFVIEDEKIGKSSVIVSPRVSIQIDRPTLIKFQAREPRLRDWQTIVQVNVMLNPEIVSESDATVK